MPCKICDREGEVDERGFCATCAAKLANLSESSSSFREKLSATVAAASTDATEQADEQTQGPHAGSGTQMSQVIVEFGQSDKFALRHPFSVASDVMGNILVMDRPGRGRYRVARFSAGGEYLGTILECEKGEGENQLKLPKGIAVDQSGNIYVPDSGNSRIQRFDAAGHPLGPIGGEGSGPGELDFPCDIEIDDVGVLYVADTYNCRVQKLTPQGVQLLSIGGDEDEPDEGSTQLDEPLGIAVDNQRNIYVADTNNHRVVKYDRNGKLLLTFGVKGSRRGELTEPCDIRVTDDEMIYVADMKNSRVQKFDAAGNVKAEFKLGASSGFSDHGGDVAVDSEGVLVICDPNKHTVAKVELFDIEPQSLGEEK